MRSGRILGALESGGSGERVNAECEQDEEGGNDAGELHAVELGWLVFRGLAGCERSRCLSLAKYR